MKRANLKQADKIKKDPYKWSPLKTALIFVGSLAAVIALCWMCKDTGLLPSEIARGLSIENLNKTTLITDLLHPDLSWALIAKLSVQMLKTIEIGFLGTVLAVLISLPLGFVGAFNLMGARQPQRGVFYSIRGLFNAVRAFEAFILVLVLASIFGFNALSGILAIGIHSVGMLGKLYAEAIENVDAGPIEAILSTGGNRMQVIFYGIIPQIFPLLIGYSLYRFDINIRMAFILGYIGIDGIGNLVLQYIQMFDINKLSTAFIITLVVISLIDYLSTSIRNRLFA